LVKMSFMVTGWGSQSGGVSKGVWWYVAKSGLGGPYCVIVPLIFAIAIAADPIAGSADVIAERAATIAMSADSIAKRVEEVAGVSGTVAKQSNAVDPHNLLVAAWPASRLVFCFIAEKHLIPS